MSIGEHATLEVFGGRLLHYSPISLNGGVVRIEGLDSRGEEIEFIGSGGQVVVAGGTLFLPTFNTEVPTLLVVESEGVVDLASGVVSLQMSAGGGSLSGSPSQGLRLTSLQVDGYARALETVSFFNLDSSYFPSLERIDRVSAWWPRQRSECIRLARAAKCGSSTTPMNANFARAHFWVGVERLLQSKDAGGRDLAIAHEVSEDARRRAAPLWDVGRVLLELSRIAGYGARVFRPLATWALVALAFAIGIRWTTDGLCVSGCSVASGFDLYWDVLVGPVTLIRPLNEVSVLTGLSHADNVARVMAFASRAFGTWMLLSFGLTLRRYLRST